MPAAARLPARDQPGGSALAEAQRPASGAAPYHRTSTLEPCHRPLRTQARAFEMPMLPNRAPRGVTEAIVGYAIGLAIAIIAFLHWRKRADAG